MFRKSSYVNGATKKRGCDLRSQAATGERSIASLLMRTTNPIIAAVQRKLSPVDRSQRAKERVRHEGMRSGSALQSGDCLNLDQWIEPRKITRPGEADIATEMAFGLLDWREVSRIVLHIDAERELNRTRVRQSS